MATNQDKELLLEWMCLLFVEVVHCHPSSVDILVCMCSFSPLIRWLRIRTRNCCWNGCVSYSLEVVHCHPSSVDILACKCSSSPWIRWLRIRTRNCCWNECVSYLLEVVHCHLSSVDNKECKCSSGPIDEMALNQDMELLLECMCLLFVGGCPLSSVFG